MPLSHSAFGLSLIANCRIPGLISEAAVRFPDTQIWLGARPLFLPLHDCADDLWYASDAHGGDAATPALRVWRLPSGHLRLLYGDGTEFVVDRAGTEVWAAWSDSSTLEDAVTYLLGPILGLVLRLRGITCLHASAVAVGSRAVAFAGPAEAGKSTLAAAFSTLGHPVLADDVAAIVTLDRALCVQPAYPQVRLWPDSAALLYGSAEALPRLTPGWDKRALDLTSKGHTFQREPLGLAAIYLLETRVGLRLPYVEAVRGREALRALLANSYVGYLLDSTIRAQEFRLLGDVVSTVPIRRVVSPADRRRVSQLCACILEDCEALGCTASPTTAR